MDLRTSDEVKKKTAAKQQEMLKQTGTLFRTVRDVCVLAICLATILVTQRGDAIRRYNGIAFGLAALNHDRTFVDVVRSFNIRCEPGYEPVRTSNFGDYRTGLTTAVVQERTRWLVHSVTVSKLNNYLKFLKCRRNVIWNICHPKNDHVAPENSMLPVIFCLSTRT